MQKRRARKKGKKQKREERHEERWKKRRKKKKEDRRRPISPHNRFYKHNDERNVEKRDLIAAQTGMPVRVRFLTHHELPPKLYNERSTHRLRKNAINSRNNLN